MKQLRFLVSVIVVLGILAPGAAGAKSFVSKEASQWTKKGWKAFPGTLSVSKQLEDSYLSEFIYDENLKPSYIFGTGESGACVSLGEAEAHAMALARMDLLSNREIAMSVNNPSFKGEIIYKASSLGDYSAMYYKNVLLLENIKEEEDVRVIYHWDALLRYSNADIYAQTAWCLYKFYRKTEDGYSVAVRICNYAPKPSKTKK